MVGDRDDLNYNGRQYHAPRPEQRELTDVPVPYCHDRYLICTSETGVLIVTVICLFDRKSRIASKVRCQRVQ